MTEKLKGFLVMLGTVLGVLFLTFVAMLIVKGLFG